MTTTDYRSSLAVQASAEVIFSVLTTGIAAWWSIDYSGAAAKVNDGGAGSPYKA
ncbi:hypothetical protein AAHN97_05415 [Chitinophaga niabensis]|uniref:hypothetical protein n=1 Tax=Chitinophaga niabensis TaxID=536979 RepID=UPI0031BB21C4